MRGITKIFHSAAGEATVLKGIDVDVYRGEFISVVGRSGSGKSTLVNMLTRIDRPTPEQSRLAMF
jgi:putative ABC transport system ATP-binding protein